MFRSFIICWLYFLDLLIYGPSTFYPSCIVCARVIWWYYHLWWLSIVFESTIAHGCMDLCSLSYLVNTNTSVLDLTEWWYTFVLSCLASFFQRNEIWVIFLIFLTVFELHPTQNLTNASKLIAELVIMVQRRW